MRRLSVILALAVVSSIVAMPPPVESAPSGPPIVDNGSFEAPDVSMWNPVGLASVERTDAASYHGGHSLLVRSGGPALGGAETEGEAKQPGQIALTLALKGTASSAGKRLLAVVEDGLGVRTLSAVVHLTPWWQTVGVTATPSGAAVRVAIEQDPSDATWLSGDEFLLDRVQARTEGPALVTTEGRQLLVDGVPWRMTGYYYAPTPPGGTPWAVHWNANPAQCQSDAQLMRAAGVNTLRIFYQEASFEPVGYRQCMDAFHAAGVKLMWLIQPPSSAQINVQDDAWIEAYWAHLRRAVEEFNDHPATLGWNIGNENSRTEPESNGFFDTLDELARRTKEIDPNHVTSTSINHPQFYGFAAPGGDGIQPGEVPNIDIWGLNFYGGRNGYAESQWQTIIDQDPSRPVWISEFGTDRYRCAHKPDHIFPITEVETHLTCHLSEGSGEDSKAQADWVTKSWEGISQHLTADDPEEAVVGGTLFMWSDSWWFALALFTGTGTPATHDVSGVGGRFCSGNACNFFRSRFPDGHLSPEWLGVNHTMPLEAPGPRVTTETYDRMAAFYTGTPTPDVGEVTVDASACKATVSYATDVPTFGRVDFGLQSRVAVGDNVHSENFAAERWAEEHEPTTEHALTLSGLTPGTTYRAYVRGFDHIGRSGTSPAIDFTTPAVPDLACA